MAALSEWHHNELCSPTTGQASACATATVPNAASGIPTVAPTPSTRNAVGRQAAIPRTIGRRGYSRSKHPPKRYTEARKRKQLRESSYRGQRIWK